MGLACQSDLYAAFLHKARYTIIILEKKRKGLAIKSAALNVFYTNFFFSLSTIFWLIISTVSFAVLPMHADVQSLTISLATSE